MTNKQIDTVEQDERGAQRKVIEPLKEPVSIKKALLGGMTAQVSSSQAVGQPASHAVFLVNIQLTGWSSDKVRAEGFADGFNKAAEWMQSAMSARAASTSANVAQGSEAVDQEIFLVTAHTSYEGDDAVRAFVMKEDAEAFARECQEYEETYKLFPAVDAPDSEWDAWRQADQAWTAAHPAAPYTRRDSYSVLSIHLTAAHSASGDTK